jgi:uncharacterized membrane protein
LTTTVDRVVRSFSRRWLLFFNLFMLAYAGLPFLAPVFMRAGWTLPARAIYTIYSPLCHQLGYRSWFLFGEQSNYPRAVFQQKTGIDPDDLWAARGFIGNDRLGYKVAFCERDVAIYGAIFLGGLIYAVPYVRRRLKPLHLIGWIVIGLFPIALDGFSQLFSQYPYNAFLLFSWLPPRESTAFLRTLTGALFGLANVWLAYPYVEDSMRDAAREVETKQVR